MNFNRKSKAKFNPPSQGRSSNHGKMKKTLICKTRYLIKVRTGRSRKLLGNEKNIIYNIQVRKEESKYDFKKPIRQNKTNI